MSRPISPWWRRRAALPLFLGVLLVGAIGCACGGAAVNRPYPAPSADDVLARLAAVRSEARSFFAKSRMEYWQEGERIKPTVLVMGEVGSRARFNALNPTGGDTAADLACDGTNFQFVDFNENCQLTGLCNRDAVARLLRVSLAPDDFLLLAVGTTPVIESTRGELEWDAERGLEILTLTAADGRRQKIVLDGREGHFDVLESTVWNPAGDVEWRLTNKDFGPLEAEDGTVFRVPERTRFEQPTTEADLVVRWLERQINLEIDPSKFTMQIPPGLPRCGAQKPATKAAQPAP